MSIADKITQLTTIRGDIRSALNDKGVSASDHDFADFAGDISSISTGGLPAEYEAVEYIESTGTQYIDTGYIPNTNDTIFVEANFSSTNGWGACMYGTRTAFVNWCYTESFTLQWNIDSNVRLQIFRYNAETYVLYGNLMDRKAQYISMPRIFSAYSTDFDTIRNTTISRNPLQPTKSLYFFAAHEPNDVVGGKSIMKFYKSYMINLNGELEFYYTPVVRKSDGKAGIYDFVRKRFDTNADTGDDFIIPT